MTILIVDDSPIDRRLAARVLEQAGFATRLATNGHEALAALENEPAEVVVTDLVMPGMDGLSLVESIRKSHPKTPVILMTAHGSDDIGVRALQRGAASYVPKRELAKALVDTVRSVLSLVGPDEPTSLTGSTHALAWELGNDPSEIATVINAIERRLARGNIIDPTERLQLSVALREAIVNAMLHGNLELSSSLKETDPDGHDRLAAERRDLAPYRSRRTRVAFVQSLEDVTCVVSDEGPGFDLSVVPDPTDPANLERASGRGLFLIRTFMSSVTHSDGGRTITMVKRRA